MLVMVVYQISLYHQIANMSAAECSFVCFFVLFNTKLAENERERERERERMKEIERVSEGHRERD